MVDTSMSLLGDAGQEVASMACMRVQCALVHADASLVCFLVVGLLAEALQPADQHRLSHNADTGVVSCWTCWCCLRLHASAACSMQHGHQGCTWTGGPAALQ